MNETIYGIHVFKSILETSPERFLEVFMIKESNNPRLKALVIELKINNIIVQSVSRQWLDIQTQGAVHQGIFAKVRKKVTILQEKNLSVFLKRIKIPFLLILDGVTDPHNLGACLRTADATGINAVIVQNNRSAQLNSVVKKTACGAAESVPIIRVKNLVRIIRLLKQMNIWIIGSSSKASRSLYQSKMIGSIAFVVGAEYKGIRHLIREHCDELVRIPMIGSVSSLNVSVATSICLFEAIRQRLS
ncbi:23S rRNA (guanosine-2'-O-)-methyltransferase RlmB [Candidatus Ecksteinia adelgidicola]|nr:23S rRNA (guanosine-2'-O-)-methyltransferase RlmB [Candidatus Ecksteinia adelgidicola]